MLADVGFHEGCGESLSYLSPLPFPGIAGHGGRVWARRALPSSSPQFFCVLVCL